VIVITLHEKMIVIQTWRFILLIIAVFSLGLSMDYLLKLPLIAIIGILIVALLVIVLIYARDRWQSETDKLRVKLTNGQQAIQPQTYDPKEIVDLPEPVQRFFKNVLQDGQAIITKVEISQHGQFHMNETEDKWHKFTATQLVATQRLGFDWDAKIQMFPFINVFVHDTYLLGEGNLQASILGLFTVAKMHNTTELNQGELLRFLAETVWYPTSLLPSQGVVWEAIDQHSSRATLTDGKTTASVVFQFDAEGLITSMRAEARCYQVVGDKLTFMPWVGNFREYAIHQGMRIPLEGEVGWEHPEGIRLYFKGKITKISYEFASSA
jgi:flagellar basal body-associated protein FliL